MCDITNKDCDCPICEHNKIIEEMSNQEYKISDFLLSLIVYLGSFAIIIALIYWLSPS